MYIGVSACLLGQNTRYDGGSARDVQLVTALGALFELVPVCPEMAAGLPAPRPPVVLLSDDSSTTLHAVTQDGNGQDITEQLAGSALTLVDKMSQMGGFVLKSKSPSCGIDDVKIFTNHGAATTKGTGIFARVLMERRPLVPVINADKLADEKVMNDFIKKVSDFHHSRRGH